MESLAELNADGSTHGPVLSRAEKEQLRADGFLVCLLCRLSPLRLTMTARARLTVRCAAQVIRNAVSQRGVARAREVIAELQHQNPGQAGIG